MKIHRECFIEIDGVCVGYSWDGYRAFKILSRSFIKNSLYENIKDICKDGDFDGGCKITKETRITIRMYVFKNKTFHHVREQDFYISQFPSIKEFITEEIIDD